MRIISMPIKAYDQDLGRIVSIYEVLNHGFEDHSFTCPYCGGEMIIVHAIKRRKHFRHKRTCRVWREKESPEHDLMKMSIYEYFASTGYRLSLTENVEVRIGDHVADIVLPSRVVVEVQASSLSQDEVVDRIANYAYHGYATLWLLYASRNNNKSMIKYTPRKWFRGNDLKDTIQAIYDVIYFFNPHEKTIGAYSIEPVGKIKRAIKYKRWHSIDELRNLKITSLKLIIFLDDYTRIIPVLLLRPYLKTTIEELNIPWRQKCYISITETNYKSLIKKSIYEYIKQKTKNKILCLY